MRNQDFIMINIYSNIDIIIIIRLSLNFLHNENGRSLRFSFEIDVIFLIIYNMFTLFMEVILPRSMDELEHLLVSIYHSDSIVGIL